MVDGHSELTIHSGLQAGGVPWKDSKQAHTAALSTVLQTLFGPQGEGWQGSLGLSVCFPSILLQCVNGFPVKSDIHEQVGMWFITSHLALSPHTPGQGSRHLFLKQALSLGHS